MTKILFLRRKKLGLGSLRGVTTFINGTEQEVPPKTLPVRGHLGDPAGYILNEEINQVNPKDWDYLVRWGCTSNSGFAREKQINTPEGIHTVADKRGFRKRLMDNGFGWTVPQTFFSLEEVSREWDFRKPLIIRPPTHSQGRKLWVAKDLAEFRRIIRDKNLAGGFYASELIDKVKEFRVYATSGRVATVAEKIPDDRNQVAWNVAQGGEFKVVRWGDWNLEVVHTALVAHSQCGLDFSGVDVMVDRDGKAYIIEINSAPSLPLLTSGAVSYRQKCMGKYFRYILENGRQPFEDIRQLQAENSWKDYIHPAITKE